jgi:hypothetical protein
MTPHELARQCAAEHGNFTEALDAWESQVAAQPDFQDYARSLLRAAGTAMIGQARHSVNVSIRKASGGYGGPPVVKPGTEVVEVALSCFDYCIGGELLGDLIVSDLPKIAEDEDTAAEGHRFNAALCRAIHGKSKKKSVPVREGINEKTLQSLFKNLQKAEKKQAG